LVATKPHEVASDRRHELNHGWEFSIETRVRSEGKDSTVAALLGGAAANSAQLAVISLNRPSLLRDKHS